MDFNQEFEQIIIDNSLESLSSGVIKGDLINLVRALSNVIWDILDLVDFLEDSDEELDEGIASAVELLKESSQAFLDIYDDDFEVFCDDDEEDDDDNDG